MDPIGGLGPGPVSYASDVYKRQARGPAARRTHPAVLPAALFAFCDDAEKKGE